MLTAEVTGAALAAAAPQPGEAVLDIGCGTGTPTLRLAEAMRPTGRVLGIVLRWQECIHAASITRPFLARASPAHSS